MPLIPERQGRTSRVIAVSPTPLSGGVVIYPPNRILSMAHSPNHRRPRPWQGRRYRGPPTGRITHDRIEWPKRTAGHRTRSHP